MTYTSKIGYEARTDASSWPGSIEAGVELVKRVLTNKVCHYFSHCDRCSIVLRMDISNALPAIVRHGEKTSLSMGKA